MDKELINRILDALDYIDERINNIELQTDINGLGSDANAIQTIRDILEES